MDLPKVTVLMSVYNGERYLKEAIESILNQTFRDFEFIIINDGSTDGTPAILARYQQMDNRIMVYNQENHGLIASLNRGCQLAKGDYIARMDADDISLPERFAKQVEFLNAHSEVGVLGTWIQWIDENSMPSRRLRPPTAPGTIGWFLIFENCLAHPSVIMRRDLVEQLGFYHPEALHAEDYDLWVRANFVTQIANIPDTLVQLRVWEGSISSRHSQIQELTVVNTMYEMIRRLLGSEVPFETVENLRRAVNGFPLSSLEQIETSASLIHQLYRVYLNANSLNHAEVREIAHDAGTKLLILAASTAKLSLKTRFFILARALRLSPSLLFSKQVIIGGIKKDFRILAGRA